MKSNTFKKLPGKGLTVALVVARFNHQITSKLETGARQALKESDVQEKNIHTYHVPGSFELPLIADRIAVASNASKKKKVNAIICLGAIIKGETSHDRHIARAVAIGIMEINLKRGIPVLFGVLTTENLAQAEARAKPGTSNKGYEAAMAGIEMAHICARI